MSALLPRTEKNAFLAKVVEPQLDQALAASLASVRTLQEVHASAPQRALRKALAELADSDAELAGARVRTSVTEAALERVRDEAEKWSTESARLEIEQRNSGIDGYWKVRSEAPGTETH